ncbi:hypothetical protein PNIG_a1143 [Pseudoalteromonas nigrifaciens]|uniref:Uncharacterized protein n=1 Tax=Pseudoalteromonas nigrifaciens TaxID=28109 RepID=A0AAC9UGU5_9GAMM|nr:hypothetical protein PNIG_a1143 [Pseudoalteromonas nigrifaciens]SUC52792.1 Uncharacterised protein [Pseudoalteromonas nigrifaciens]
MKIAQKVEPSVTRYNLKGYWMGSKGALYDLTATKLLG